ncbi:MAG: phosphoadenosine phosphosulfate reductase family protein, partial [Desulfurococcaceae archaeon]
MLITTYNPLVQIAKHKIKTAFSQYKRLAVAWSGGKDSTTLLALAIEVLRENSEDWSLVIVHNDTLVENPIVREHCDKSIEELRDYIVRENLPIEIRIARPSTKETFWVNLIGKGYPLPYHNLRWCQRALKIKPFSKVVRDINAVLVGVREKESNARKGLINKNY